MNIVSRSSNESSSLPAESSTTWRMGLENIHPEPLSNTREQWFFLPTAVLPLLFLLQTLQCGRKQSVQRVHTWCSHSHRWKAKWSWWWLWLLHHIHCFFSCPFTLLASSRATTIFSIFTSSQVQRKSWFKYCSPHLYYIYKTISLANTTTQQKEEILP